jgi:hypothetical protein
LEGCGSFIFERFEEVRAKGRQFTIEFAKLVVMLEQSNFIEFFSPLIVEDVGFWSEVFQCECSIPTLRAASGFLISVLKDSGSLLSVFHLLRTMAQSAKVDVI